MLVDLPPGWDQTQSMITAFTMGPDYMPRRLAKGVYLTHHNFNHDIEKYVKGEYPFSFWYNNDREALGEDEYARRLAAHDWETDPADYGVCDRWEQITERWPQILDDPRKLIISLTEVKRSEQLESGGWRWHKWGTYIGEHTPTQEYLYDEPEIDSVFCFSILEVH